MREHGTWRRYAYEACRCEPCRRAYSEYKRNKRLGRLGPSTHLLRWPLQPLFDATDTTEFLELAVRTGFPARTLHRWAHAGLRDVQADRVAVALGKHPSSTWVDWFEPLIQEQAA
ncbi:MAG: hypothetical protein WCJ22_02595 [Actinomycetes bacterium]